jgi:hypothetical protein
MLLSVGPAVKNIETQIPYNIISNLSASYRDLLTQDNFLELVTRQPEIQQNAEQLKKAIVVQANPGSPYFEVTMVDTNPNRLLTQLGIIGNLLTGPTLQLKEIQLSFEKQFIQDRLTELNQLIAQRQEELKTFGAQLGLQDEVQNNNARSAAQQVAGEIDSYQQEIKDLTKLVNNPEANQVNLVEKPHLVPASIGPQPLYAALTVAALSLLVGIGLVIALDKIENIVHSGDQAMALVKRAIPTNFPPGRVRAGDRQPGLIAAELYALFIRQQNLKRVRLLILYEEHTRGIPAMLNELTQELYKLGNFVKVINVGREASLEPAVSTEVAEEMPGPAPADTGIFSSPIIRPPVFEIVSHPWMDNLNYLIMENHGYAGALIACSPKVSSKTGLVALSRFLVKARFQIMGLILL